MLRSLHLALFTLNLNVLHVLLEFPVDGELVLNLAHRAVHDLILRQVAANHVEVVCHSPQSVSFEPVAEVLSALVRDLVLNEGELLQSVLSLLDGLQDLLKAVITDLILVEFDRLELGLLETADERADVDDAGVEDVIVRIVNFLQISQHLHRFEGDAETLVTEPA